MNRIQPLSKLTSTGALVSLIVLFSLMTNCRAGQAPAMSVAALSASVPMQAAKKKPEADTATFVILAPEGPVIAELRVSVALMPYRRWVSRYLARQMDVNKDGRLTATELGLLNDTMKKLANVPAGQKVLELMAAGTDVSDVDAMEFAEWLRNRLPRAFDLIAQPQAADDAVRLSSLVDVDQNGIVSTEELQDATRTLRFRDLDNDESFSLSELMPFRDPRSRNSAVTPEVANLPYFHVTDEASRRTAAERIIKRYGTDGKIAASEFRLPSLAEKDSLETDAVAAFLDKPEFHLTLDVRLSDKAGSSDVVVTIQQAAASFVKLVDEKFGRKILLVDGVRMTVVARGGSSSNRTDTKGYLGQSFVMADGDKSQSLDESEFPGIQATLDDTGITATFKELDADGDLQLTREELFGYGEREQAAIASRIEVTVEQDGKTLFDLLDENDDRRLTVREFRLGPEVLKQYDGNGDGRFAETELGTEYILTIGLGRSEYARSEGMMSGMQMMPGQSPDAIIPGRDSLSGPEWFRRMDRNQDGDLSQREFLGTPEQFRKLDADNDLLINAEEAESVTPQSGEKN